MRILVLSSAFPPDPASVGQHMADVASWAIMRGHQVNVITADRGYEDARIRYPHVQITRGIEIVRLRWSSFGKRSFLTRVSGQVLFSVQAFLRGLTGIRPDVVLVSTTPPFGIAAAFLLSVIRRLPLVYWVMDINPDQAIAMGMVSRGSLPAYIMGELNKTVLGSASAVITLDSFMACKLAAKIPKGRPIVIIPPWPHDETVRKGGDRGCGFRKIHHLEDKFVVMYSGNHSWVHPLDTILEAARALALRKDIIFLFIGQGNEKAKIKEAVRQGASNIRCLPFQPLEDLGDSLAAADAHLVVMGDSMVGIVHPCKIYNAMSVEKPILAVAPQICHISDILDGNNIGMRFSHGDGVGLARGILAVADMKPEERAEMGKRAGALARERWNQTVLIDQFLKVLEEAARTGEK